MKYFLEFSDNLYCVSNHISLYKIKDMNESSNRTMTPYCPDCDVSLICDDQRRAEEHIGWCSDCGEDFYEDEIRKYEIDENE